MPYDVIDLGLATAQLKPGHRSGYYTETEVLDAAEKDGWELICVSGGKAYLYRDGNGDARVAQAPQPATAPAPQVIRRRSRAT